MNTQDFFNLLYFLDNLFRLGGKLVEAAIEKEPMLKTEPLPVLDEMDLARQDAIDRLSKK